MTGRIRLKRLLAMAITVMLLLSTVFPVTASSAVEENIVKGPAQMGSSLSVPLNFDGNELEKSQVVVKNSEEANGLMRTNVAMGSGVDNGLPQKVETIMTSAAGVTAGVVTLVTADRYFLHTDKSINTQKLQFMAECTDLESVAGKGNYVAKLTKSESDTSVTLTGSFNEHTTFDSFYFSDISQIISSPTLPRVIYISIWKDNIKLYGADVTVRYVEDSVADIPSYYEYLRSDSMDFYTNIEIPDSWSSQITTTSGLVMSMVNSAGQVVARSMQNIYLSGPYNNSSDYRYDSVFSYSNYFDRNYISVSGPMYKAANLAIGSYGLKISLNGSDIQTFNDLIQVVDGIVVDQIYVYGGNGFPPPVAGGTDVYVEMDVNGAGKDDFDVYLKDKDDNTIGTLLESRYSGSDIIYHMRLSDDKTFDTLQSSYFIQFVSKDTSASIYYSGDNPDQFYPEDYFRIYDWKYDTLNNKAVFNLKTVNSSDVQGGNVTFKLFNSYNPSTSASAIATVNAVAADQMNIEFKDGSGNVITLGSGENTLIAYFNSGSTSSWSFYVSSSSSNSARMPLWGNPFFYESDTAYEYRVALSKNSFGLSDSSTYEISLVDMAGNVLAATQSGITIQTITYSDNYAGDVEAFQLSGTIAITPGAITEGQYYIKSTIFNNTNDNDSAKTIIACIKSSKVYATSSYPEFNTDSGVSIEGYAYMLKKAEGYDASKFSYEMADLNGNPVTVGSATVDTGTDNYTYQDYVSVDAVVNGDIPAAYYYLKLKYDGKDIYDLYNPSELLFTGNDSFEALSYEPDLRSWYVRNDSIFAVELTGRTEQADARLILYNPNNKLIFTPVKTITLIKNSDGLFVIPANSLVGLDTSIPYELVLLVNSKYMGYFTGLKITSDDVQIIAVTGISLDQSSLNIKVAEMRTLTATVAPANASVKTVNWSSGNTSVATVDSKGQVTGVAPGTAVITATTESGNKTAQCTVNVAANIATLTITKLAYADSPDTAIEAVNGVYNIDGAKFPLTVSKPLKIMLQGTNYTAAKNYSYSISINNKAPFETGTVTGSAILAGWNKEIVRDSQQLDGDYTYNIIIKDGSTQVAALLFKLKISGTPIPVSGVTVNKQILTMAVGDSTTLSAIILPSNATNKKVTWTSSNTTVAAVDASTGVVTAAGAGNAVITATTEDGAKTATSTVNVGINVSGTLTYGSNAASGVWVSLYKGDSYISGKFTDSEGKFTFPKLMTGDYSIQAYSYNTRYNSLNQSLTIAEGDASAGAVIGFESKYANAAVLTVTVEKQGGGSLGSPFSLYVYSYETGVSSWNTYDGSSTTVTIPDLPYSGNGTLYAVSLSTSEQTDYYYKYESVTINGATAACSFNVPVTYKIKGTVKDTNAMPIQFTSVKAVGSSNTYWTFTDSNGEFIVMGLYNGDYDLSVVDSRFESTTSVSVAISGMSVTTGVSLVVEKGMTLTGKVLKDAVPAYKAYVTLTDNAGNWVTSGYAAGEGGFVFDGAIKKAGTYKLTISGVYNKGFVYQNFVSQPVNFTVTPENITAGRMSVDLIYSDPTTGSQVFTGSDNMVLANKGVVRSGSSVSLVVKYKNNGNSPVNADFAVTLPAGVTGSNTFSVTNLTAGESGEYRIALTVGAASGNYLKIPVTVTIGGTEYDFGSVTLEVAGITINGPGAVRTTDTIKIYGEATAGSIIKIKNAATGEVLGSATPNGRWYSAELKPLPEGTYELVAEAVKGDIITLSKLLSVESKADQITINKVLSGSAGSADLPFNKLIGVRAFTAWVDAYLNGRDINLGVLFENGASISSVTYHFSDLDFAASKDSNGYWLADIKGWSGAGLKTITATVKTTDNRTLIFIIAEVTVLIDPSGTVTDAETGEPLENATAICEVKSAGIWEAVDPNSIGALNPQPTDNKGQYGWGVLPGTYRVRVAKEGYAGQISAEMDVPPERQGVNFALMPNILVSSISLNKYTMTLTAGNSETLTATVAPVDAINAGKVAWTSSNTGVATVANGVVSAVSAGTATITAKAGNCTTSCAITVNAAVTPDGNNVIPSGGSPLTSAPAATPTSGTAITSTAVTLEADNTGKTTIKAGQLDKAEKLVIKASAAELTFDKASVAALSSVKGDITVKVTKLDASGLSAESKSIIGDRPVYEFTATAGDKAIVDFGGGSVRISIPYTPKAGEDTSAIVIYFIDASGKLNMISGCTYDPATKTISFKTSHFSKYAVGYNKKDFSDIPSWAKEYITYLSAREIFNGIGEGKYGSAGNITRADFVTALARIAGVDLSKTASSKFADVDAKAYYANAVVWAANKGITKGTGDNKFSPKAFITRQDMAVMIQNFTKAMNYNLPVITAESKFADQSSISSYAASASSTLQRSGIISGKTVAGKSGMFFAPKENATRAETAKILALLLKNMSK